MKVLVLSLLLFVTGCSYFTQNDANNSTAISIWNPLSYSWSALLPWNWFRSSLTLNEQGLNGLNAQTVLSDKILQQAVGNTYTLRSGMRLINRDIYKFWQAMIGRQVAFEFIGNTTLAQMTITTKTVKGPGGETVGSLFSKTYQHAFPNCKRNAVTGEVRCQAAHSQHIFYVFNGKTTIRKDLLPPDAQLAEWKLTKMQWQN